MQLHCNGTKEKLDERTYYPRFLLVYTVTDVQVRRNDTKEIMTRELHGMEQLEGVR